MSGIDRPGGRKLRGRRWGQLQSNRKRCRAALACCARRWGNRRDHAQPGRPAADRPPGRGSQRHRSAQDGSSGCSPTFHEIHRESAVAPTNKKSINEPLGLNVEDASLGSCITDACLRIDTVLEITGLSRPTLYREISQRRFPRPIKITTGRAPGDFPRSWSGSTRASGTPA
jgi:predicted DNA-binding transcriptional regulator AlpA